MIMYWLAPFRKIGWKQLACLYQTYGSCMQVLMRCWYHESNYRGHIFLVFIKHFLCTCSKVDLWSCHCFLWERLSHFRKKKERKRKRRREKVVQYTNQLGFSNISYIILIDRITLFKKNCNQKNSSY